MSSSDLTSIWQRLPNEASKRLSPTEPPQTVISTPTSPRSSFSGSTFSAAPSSSASPQAKTSNLPVSTSSGVRIQASSRSIPSAAIARSSGSDNKSDEPVSTHHTEAALAEIFCGQVRPHFTSPKLLDQRPVPTPRSYFSPSPLSPPSSGASRPFRIRSQSMSPGYDREHQQQLHQQGHDAREMMDHSNGIYSTSGAPLQQRGFDLQQASHTNNAADQHGYRPSNSTNYSASMPAGLSHPGAIRIGTSEGTTTLRGRGSDSLEDSRSPSRPRLNQFSTGSYNGGAHAFDQTGWRGPSSVGQTSAFGWEDADREGRTRLREEIQRPWGNERSLSQTSGIGVSNMSPFTRDGGRTLAGLDDGPSMYKARRDYSLGAVGSGRKRSDSAWGGERTLKEADDEDDDALAPPTKSGATSRRHSFAAFNPPSRSTTLGFSLPDENRDPVATIASSFGSSSLRRSGLGSSAIDDDDLAADLNSLHLNLEAHAARVETDEARQQPRYVGSMPTNFPSHISSRTDVITGDDDFRQKSPSLSNSATASQPLKSPPLSSTSALGASRFFSPQQAAPTTSITPSTAERMSSRFEFGSGNVSAAPGHQGVGSLALNDFASGVFGGRQQQHQQQQQQPQQAPNRFVPSFGLPPPSPPASFYSTPFGAPGLNTKSPSFGSFNQQPLPPFSGPPLQQQQQQSFFSSPGPQGRQTSPPGQGQPDLVNLGRGVPLHAVPANAPLYIVEFKAGRKDLFYVEDPNLQLRQGDLVIVEADRGRDVGKYFKPCSLDEVQAFQQRLVEMALGQLASAGQTVGPGGVPLSGPGGAGAAPPNAAALARMTKEFQPKRLYGKAGPADTQMLLSKAQDEVKALALVRNKVAQKNLPMEVCDAEWQWDRRKLTFYYTADSRVDFRELVRELFRVYKTRVWMCCLDQQSASWDYLK